MDHFDDPVCAGILLPASLPHPRSGVLEAKMKGAWEDGNRDDDVESSDEGKIICRESKITDDSRKIRTPIEILILYNVKNY